MSDSCFLRQSAQPLAIHDNPKIFSKSFFFKFIYYYCNVWVLISFTLPPEKEESCQTGSTDS